MAPAILALAFFFLPTTILAETFHVPLVRRAPHKTNWKQHIDGLRIKYGYMQAPIHKPHRSDRRAVAEVPVLDQGSDSSYIAGLTIGTPPQSFDVVLDTGSSDLWFAGPNCNGCPTGSASYESTQSSTFKQISSETIPIAYGSGQVVGTVGSDTVAMGHLTVASQTILTVTQLQGSLVDAPVSGLMGLAFAGLSGTNSVPFWQALTNNSELSSPEFSFWLGRDVSPDPNALLAGGAFTLGGTNSSLFSGQVQFTDVILLPGSPQLGFWLVTLTGLDINGTALTLSSTNASAAIDTGTTLIGGPKADIQSFYNSIPGSKPLSGSDSAQAGMYTFPCSTSVSVSMAFGGGQSWTIKPVDFNAGVLDSEDPTTCVGALFDITAGSPPDANTPDWIIGDSFLKNVYTVFRSSPPSVGFAQLSTAAGGTGTSTGTSPSGSSSSPGPSSGAVSSSAVPASLILTTAFTAVIMFFCL